MAEITQTRRARHRDRLSQVGIYLGKQLRFFIYQSDWKVLPMAGIIAALVAMVIRRRIFLSMEGDLLGAFALACVAIWNGCFNSIQSVCRERGIVKREHRSGMHISSYVAAHMIYQLVLCLAQTVITMTVLSVMGLRFSDKPGFITPWRIVDIGVTMLLISYASDMISLFISSIAHTTTGAMTVMPFMLIFQLVFSGGIIELSQPWAKQVSRLTISNYGIRAITAQAGYNEDPMMTIWKFLDKDSTRSREVDAKVTVAQLLEKRDSPIVQRLTSTVLVENDDSESKGGNLKVADILELLAVGEDPELEKVRNYTISIHTTVDELIQLFGEDNLKRIVQDETRKISYNAAYASEPSNVYENWLYLLGFAALFALLATISLELIDRDKR